MEHSENLLYETVKGRARQEDRFLAHNAELGCLTRKVCLDFFIHDSQQNTNKPMCVPIKESNKQCNHTSNDARVVTLVDQWSGGDLRSWGGGRAIRASRDHDCKKPRTKINAHGISDRMESEEGAEFATFEKILQQAEREIKAHTHTHPTPRRLQPWRQGYQQLPR